MRTMWLNFNLDVQLKKARFERKVASTFSRARQWQIHTNAEFSTGRVGPPMLHGVDPNKWHVVVFAFLFLSIGFGDRNRWDLLSCISRL